MAEHTPAIARRSLLSGIGGASAAVALTGAPATARVSAAAAVGAALDLVGPDDARYRGLQTGNNQRYVATPEYVALVRSTPDVVRVVQHAINTGKRVSVRGGGHCFEDFACHPGVDVLIDTSPLDTVEYDDRVGAFEVGPGARLLRVYERLATGWGVTLPGGICYSVGAGGHVAGGGYGLLSRTYGLVVDHLWAVEVVVVDGRGKARAVTATREDRGALGDLFWAHTGGGGGNFGVVTRYWFRSAGTRGLPPRRQLPPVPATVLVSAFDVPWADLDEAGFKRLVGNFARWHEQHRDPGTPESRLSSLVNISHQAHGSIGVFTQLDAAVPSAREVLDRYNAALLEGVGVVPRSLVRGSGELPPLPGLQEPRELPWLQATKLVGTDNPTITNPTSRGAHKSAYFNEAFTEDQIGVLYRAMTQADFTNPDTMLVMFSFGGAVNAVDPAATANAQRRSAFKICLQTFWQDQADDEFYIGWERSTFEGMFAATGGVPVPGGQTDGCYINYPDRDMQDPARNTSGVPWSRLYYLGNYERLQRTKAAWDPTDFFRHRMSVELPGVAR